MESFIPGLVFFPSLLLIFYFLFLFFQQNEPEKKRGTEKRVRSERDVVLETIFSAFEKHQYYTLKDLIGITQQPVVSC